MCSEGGHPSQVLAPMLRRAGTHTPPLHTPQPCMALSVGPRLSKQPDFFSLDLCLRTSGKVTDMTLKHTIFMIMNSLIMLCPLRRLRHHTPTQLLHLPKLRHCPH